MSILDTFLLLFETNAKEIKTETDEAKKVTDDLEHSLGKSDVAANKLSGSFMTMAEHASTFLAAFVGVGALIERVFSTSEFTAMLNDASETLGQSATELSVWGAAVKENGGTTEGFISSIQSLNSAMAQVDATGKSRLLPFFNQLGIKMLDAHGKARPVMELLPEIADSFQKMDKGQSNAFGRRLGLDQGTILLLQQGRREVDAILTRYREYGVITEKDAKISDNFHDSIDRLAYSFTVMFTKIGSVVLPPLTYLFDKFSDFVGFINTHGTLVESIIGTGLVVAFLRLANAIRIFIGWYGLMQTLMLGIAPIIAFGEALFSIIAFAVSPFGLAIAGLFLIVNDFISFMKGAPSVIGYVIDKLTNAFTGFGGKVVAVFDYLDRKIAAFIEKIIGLIGYIKSLTGEQSSPAYTVAGIAQRGLSTATGIGAQAQGLNYEAFRNSNAVKNTTVNVGAVNVNTQATDADGMARAASSGLSTQLRHAVNNYDDGVAK